MASCSPQELQRLTELLNEGRVGSLESESIVENPSTANAADGEARKHLPLAFSYRPARYAFGEELGPRAIDPLWQGSTRTENFINKNRAQILESLSDAGVTLSPENDTLLNDAVQLTDRQGRYVGKGNTFPQEVIESAKRTRGIINRLEDVFGIDFDKFQSEYARRRMLKPQGIMDDPREELFVNSLKPGHEFRFYREMERKGALYNFDGKFTNVFDAYLRAGANLTFMKPILDRVESEVVNPFFNVEFVRDGRGIRSVLVDNKVFYQKWLEYKNNLLGGVTQSDLTWAEMGRTLAAYAGHEMSSPDAVRALYKYSQLFQTLWYSGALGSPLGGRPASTLRHMFRLVNSWAEFGEKHIAVGLKDALSKENVGRLEEMGLIGSPIEKLVEQTDLASKAGKAISTTSDMFLKVFSGVDKWMRATTALAAESKFNEHEAAGTLNQIKARRGFRDEFTRLVDQGKISEARNAYMREAILNLEYGFGRANKPESFRGALGSVLGMLTTYPLNTLELYRIMGSRAGEFVGDVRREGLKAIRTSKGDPLPLLRMVGLSTVLMYAGSQYFNTDLSHTIFHGAFSTGMPVIEGAMAAGTFLKSQAEHVMGDIYGVGETNYHKMKRAEAVKNMENSLAPFVPGGVFFVNDIYKNLIDRGDIGRFLGFNPVASVLDDEARERARIKRADAASEKEEE